MYIPTGNMKSMICSRFRMDLCAWRAYTTKTTNCFLLFLVIIDQVWPLIWTSRVRFLSRNSKCSEWNVTFSRRLFLGEKNTQTDNDWHYGGVTSGFNLRSDPPPFHCVTSASRWPLTCCQLTRVSSGHCPFFSHAHFPVTARVSGKNSSFMGFWAEKGLCRLNKLKLKLSLTHIILHLSQQSLRLRPSLVEKWSCCRFGQTLKIQSKI